MAAGGAEEGWEAQSCSAGAALVLLMLTAHAGRAAAGWGIFGSCDESPL